MHLRKGLLFWLLCRVFSVAAIGAATTSCNNKGEEGESCKSEGVLQGSFCDEGLICNAANICQKPMTVRDGGHCNVNELCKAGLWCDLMLRACRPFLPEGDPCINPTSVQVRQQNAGNREINDAQYTLETLSAEYKPTSMPPKLGDLLVLLDEEHGSRLNGLCPISPYLPTTEREEPYLTTRLKSKRTVPVSGTTTFAVAGGFPSPLWPYQPT